MLLLLLKDASLVLLVRFSHSPHLLPAVSFIKLQFQKRGQENLTTLFCHVDLWQHNDKHESVSIPHFSIPTREVKVDLSYTDSEFEFKVTRHLSNWVLFTSVNISHTY